MILAWKVTYYHEALNRQGLYGGTTGYTVREDATLLVSSKPLGWFKISELVDSDWLAKNAVNNQSLSKK